jgi:SAM-dependent methyltransferase
MPPHRPHALWPRTANVPIARSPTHCCTCSVQYLQQPEKVFAEVYRVLKPGGVFIITFSNRLFYTKVRRRV